MDLPTHFAFGLAVGFVFFGSHPGLALLVPLGALVPDLDREYWFVPRAQYQDEQPHRALFHNVLVVAGTYAVSPFLSLGVFLHIVQDSFTTVKDRGVEWFYPFTRLAKRGRYNDRGEPQPADPKEHVYFYQEDPAGLAKLADPDLQEQTSRPVPWRRVYGFAQNSQLLDRGFLLGSVAVVLVWLFVPGPGTTFSDLAALRDAGIGTYEAWALGLLAIGTLFLSGEVDRRDGTNPSLARLKPARIPLFVAGLFLSVFWVGLNSGQMGASLSAATASPLQLVLMAAAIPLIALLLVRRNTKNGTQDATI